MDPEGYLSRIGLDSDRTTVSARVGDGLESVERLQRAHVRSVPFENLSVIGDPFGEDEGDGLSLDLPVVFEKVVDRRRGGLCFELNGLFGWLLDELGYDVRRLSGRVFADENGELHPLDSHLTLLVTLDRRYVVDVGFGDVIRRPLPLDGTVHTVDGAWRVVESRRPETDYAVQFRPAGTERWTEKYIFEETRRTMDYFERSRQFHQSDPRSPFTGDPLVTMATERGRKTLSGDALTWTERGEKRRREVEPDAWHDVLAREFGFGR